MAFLFFWQNPRNRSGGACICSTGISVVNLISSIDRERPVTLKILGGHLRSAIGKTCHRRAALATF